jgi:hypothetical protein
MHLVWGDDVLSANVQRPADQLVVGFYCCRIVAHRMTGIQGVPRRLAMSSQARKNAMCQTAWPQEAVKLIVYQRSIPDPSHSTSYVRTAV